MTAIGKRIRDNGVNLAHGYGSIAIHTPQEVITDED
jgi:hypothetical protein